MLFELDHERIVLVQWIYDFCSPWGFNSHVVAGSVSCCLNRSQSGVHQIHWSSSGADLAAAWAVAGSLVADGWQLVVFQNDDLGGSRVGIFWASSWKCRKSRVGLCDVICKSWRYPSLLLGCVHLGEPKGTRTDFLLHVCCRPWLFACWLQDS